MKICFIQTGGTIDKDYPRTSKGWAFEFGEPATLRLLDRLKPGFDFEVLTAFQKDSLEITEADRWVLVQLINGRLENEIIVTHGTDTLNDTADFLRKHCPHKTVVLTGAMRPERFSNSDAPLNLGMAIATVQLGKPGVYICLHGQANYLG